MNFKNISDSSKGQYLAGDKGVVVYLESTDDVFVFKKWFGNLLENIEFQSISGKKEDGGCGLIIKRIEEDIDAIKPIFYGIVDRDVLLRNINNEKYPNCESLWWNHNDHEFFAYQPFGERIFILHRWELENYLLHPKALHKLLENKTRGETGLNSTEKVAQKIIKNEADLITITLLATLGRGDRNPRHAQQKVGEELLNQVKNDTRAPEDKITQHQENIIQFSQEEDDPIKRWDKLSRMLDGKRIMYRLDKILDNPNRLCLNDEYGTLAEHIANLGLIDANIKNWLQKVSNTY